MTKRKCPLCCGTGVLPLEKMLIPCVDCDGKGYIEEESFEDEETD